jgi:hypothetical protein
MQGVEYEEQIAGSRSVFGSLLSALRLSGSE